MNQPPSNDTAYFCPHCGSPAIQTSSLAGGEGSCSACAWKGRVEDLVAFHFSHDMGSAETVTRAFLSDVTKLLSKDFALLLARLIIKWGFIHATPPKHPIGQQLYARELGRYVSEAAKAVAISLIKTRETIELEKHQEKVDA